jgi:1,4-alpha-glucan branching enzyme
MTGSASDRGELAIVLHSHMPYVEGFGTWPFGEEWLFEAMATAYLPLIELLESFAETGARDVLTVGVTPVLADQLAIPAVGERFLRFVREVRRDSHRIDIEGLERDGQREAADALRRSARLYESAADRFEQIDRDVAAALRRLHERGLIELWGSAATHAVLPLLASEAGVRLQVGTGIDSHRARFGDWSGGFWLPECAYREGIGEQLALHGVRAFCVYRPRDDGSPPFEPLALEGGSVAVPIDWETIALVWDDRGYPADPVYRDYHAPTLNGMRPFANGGGPYVAEAAEARARGHARDFVSRVIERLGLHRDRSGRAGLAVCALDTELLGHWWHEGPVWLSAVVEEAGARGLALTTLPAALERHDPRPAQVPEGSWGAGKGLRTWDSPAVAEFVWPTRRAELRLCHTAEGAHAAERAHAAGHAALERAARELLTLQSSDWAFMATRRLAADYPQLRVRDHAAAFERALAAASAGVKDSRPVSGTGEAAAIEPHLRGLAPQLRLAPLLEPASAWGRMRAERLPAPAVAPALAAEPVS